MILRDAQKQFLKLITSSAQSYSPMVVFGDAVHMMAQSLWSACLLGKQKEAVEEDWQLTRQKYNDVQFGNFAKAFAVMVDALEVKREDFLGTILEEIGAANTHNGQFLTPTSVSRMMARITASQYNYTDGEILRLNDPACGASVLLIEGAEAMLERGVKQCNIMIEAGDIDIRACDMSYIQLSLLGYPAIVRHQNALSMQEYSPARYTIGYFIHGMPMRNYKASREKPYVETIKPEVQREISAVAKQAMFDF